MDEELSPVDLIDQAIAGVDAPAETVEPPEEPATEPVAAETPEEPAAQAEEPAPIADEDPVVKEARELGLKTRAQARFKKLNEDLATDRAKLAELEGKTPEYEALRGKAQVAEELQQTISATGITPQNFGVLMNVTADMNSGDPGRMDRALQFITAQKSYLEQQLGKSAEAMDGDLKQKVTAGTLSQEDALELMQHRKGLALHQQSQQRNTQQQGVEQAKEQGKREIAAFEASMAADPTYKAKEPQLMAYLRSIAPVVAPNQWAPMLRQFYTSLPNPAPAPAPRIGPVPLRPTGSGQQVKNLTPLEIMSQAVDNA